MLLSSSTNNSACPNANMEKNAKDQTSSMAALKCPRCNSSNTKFCYYNNYSLSQPRHFCKACKRYWTRGGTLRNVPIGGGCRKNKRLKKPTITSSSSSALLSCHPSPPPPPSSLPLISATTTTATTSTTTTTTTTNNNNNMEFNIHYANLPPLPAFLQQPHQLDGFNLGYPSNAPTNHDQQQHLFDPLLGSSLSTATAASLLLSSIKQQQQQQQQQTMMLSCDNLQSAHEDGNLGLGFVKQVKMEADQQQQQHHHHHHHHNQHAWMQAPCGNLFETMPAVNTTVGDSPSANLFWSWNQSIGPLI